MKAQTFDAKYEMLVQAFTQLRDAYEAAAGIYEDARKAGVLTAMNDYVRTMEKVKANYTAECTRIEQTPVK